jgi:hypothetical protein
MTKPEDCYTYQQAYDDIKSLVDQNPNQPFLQYVVNSMAKEIVKANRPFFIGCPSCGSNLS